MKDQSIDITKVQPSESTTFIGGHLEKYGYGFTYSSTNGLETAVSSKSTLEWEQLTKAGNLKHRAQPTGSSTGWRVCLSGAFIGLNLSR